MPLSPDQRLALYFEILKTTRRIFAIGFRSSMVLGVAFFAWQTFIVLAGKNTNLGVQILTDLFSQLDMCWIAVPVAVFAMVVVFLQGRERHAERTRLQDRIRELELRLDPDRSSSYFFTRNY